MNITDIAQVQRLSIRRDGLKKALQDSQSESGKVTTIRTNKGRDVEVEKSLFEELLHETVEEIEADLRSFGVEINDAAVVGEAATEVGTLT